MAGFLHAWGHVNSSQFGFSFHWQGKGWVELLGNVPGHVYI